MYTPGTAVCMHCYNIMVAPYNTHFARTPQQYPVCCCHHPLQIDRADEFDLMFTWKIDCDINYNPEHGVSQMYCALKPKPGQVPSVLVGDDGWLCPMAFLRYFQDRVDESMRELGRLEDGRTSVQRHLSECESGL